MAQDIQLPLPLGVQIPGDANSGWQAARMGFHNDISASATGVAEVPIAEISHSAPTVFSDIGYSLDFLFDPDQAVACTPGESQTYLIHDSPRILYIKDFVSETERRHLIDASEPHYQQSGVYSAGSQTGSVDRNSRRSEVANPPRDLTLQCIEQRASRVQPWGPDMALEFLGVQRYEKGGFFILHHDSVQPQGIPNRKTTLNVFLEGDCVGGGTHFPNIPRPNDTSACDIIDCESELPGTVFKPIPGNAIFWENIGPDLRAYNETTHQALPLESGTKIGLNIWAWQLPNDASYVFHSAE